ncbi:cation:proton antiporter, partial [Thiolapillus sp.]|uniref:cation:proton antiporter domain-containing protein n=1 Tax=Thiolapillus sp. TaxID=2017437 RepID=UPI003AF7BA12
MPQPSWSPSTTQQLRKLVAAPYLAPNDWTPRSEAYFVFPLAQGTPGKQCGLAATGVYQPSLRSPWLAAGALTATSIGITIRVLTDLHQRNTREGQIVLGAAVLDDVLGVVLLALLYEFSIAGGITLANTSKVLAFIGLFFILAPIAAKLISLLIKHFDDIRVSRPAESHRQPLAEPYVTLSRHTAPIIRPFACPLQCTKT